MVQGGTERLMYCVHFALHILKLCLIYFGIVATLKDCVVCKCINHTSEADFALLCTHKHAQFGFFKLKQEE